MNNNYQFKFDDNVIQQLKDIITFSKYEYGKKVCQVTIDNIRYALNNIRLHPYQNNVFSEERQIRRQLIKKRPFSFFYHINQDTNIIYVFKIFHVRENIIQKLQKIKKELALESFTNKFLADIDKMNQQIIEDFRNSF